MRTAYYSALNYKNFSLGDSYIKENEGGNQMSIVGIGTSAYFYDLYNFSDRMHVDTPISRDKRQGFSYKSSHEKWLNALESFPVLGVSTVNVSTGSTIIGIGNSSIYAGYETVQKSQENVMKAMLLAILDGDSKRTTNVGVGTTRAKMDIFFKIYD